MVRAPVPGDTNTPVNRIYNGKNNYYVSNLCLLIYFLLFLDYEIPFHAPLKPYY